MLSQGGTRNKRGSLPLPIGNNTTHLDSPLPNGSRLNIRFLLGVQQTATFKFFINVEAFLDT